MKIWLVALALLSIGGCATYGDSLYDDEYDGGTGYTGVGGTAYSPAYGGYRSSGYAAGYLPYNRYSYRYGYGGYRAGPYSGYYGGNRYPPIYLYVPGEHSDYDDDDYDDDDWHHEHGDDDHHGGHNEHGDRAGRHHGQRRHSGADHHGDRTRNPWRQGHPREAHRPLADVNHRPVRRSRPTQHQGRIREDAFAPRQGLASTFNGRRYSGDSQAPRPNPGQSRPSRPVAPRSVTPVHRRPGLPAQGTIRSPRPRPGSAKPSSRPEPRTQGRARSTSRNTAATAAPAPGMPRH